MVREAHEGHDARGGERGGVDGTTPFGRRRAREPLIYFALGGLGIFVVDAWWGAEPARTIRVRDSLRAPERVEDGEAEGPVRAGLDDEILYREALALGLDQDDPIVRRRMIQKMRFFLEGRASSADPGDAQLGAFLLAHADDYRISPRVDFRQDYYGDGPTAHEDARRGLAERVEGTERSLGVAISLGPRLRGQTRGRIASDFGAEFADDVLVGLQIGTWFLRRSARGWHTVRVDARMQEMLPSLSSIRGRVLQDWRAVRREDALAEGLEDLRGRYTIEPQGEE